MSATVEIPVWLIVAAWALAGRALAGTFINDLATNLIVGRRPPFGRIRLSAVVVATGPLVWLPLLWAFAVERFNAAKARFLNPKDGQQ